MAAVVAAAAAVAVAAAEAAVAVAGGMGGADEKPGSTRILEIVKEGTRVKAGDIVAKLDGAAYEDEEQVQKIRYLQAKSYVEHANTMLEVSLITLKEYRDGIYPQDVQLIRQYIQTCQLESDRLERAYQWSQDMRKKGYRTSYQVDGDRLALEQANIALAEAKGMLDRLVNQTGPKIIKSLEANVRAIESDKLTQDASFSLEEQRLNRIRKNIENCIVRAPGDGIVVYVNQADRWGTVTAPIDEGVTLRQDQPIFSLPDPKHMRVKARVNESKVTLIHTGSTCVDFSRRVSRTDAARHRGRGDRDQYAFERLRCAGLLRQRRDRSRDSTTCVRGSVRKSRSMSILART